MRSVASNMRGLATSIIGLGAAFGAAELFKSAISGAQAFDAQMRATKLAVESTGGSFPAYSAQIDKLAAGGARLGYTNTEVLAGFRQLTLTSGNATDALKYMGLVEDLAKSKGLSLQMAATAIGKAIEGKTTALQRYGIVVQKGQSVEDALTEAEKRYHGQALANTTVTEKLHATITNLEEKIGQALLPSITKVADAIEQWISKAQNQKRVTDDVKSALDGLITVIRAVITAGETVYDALGRVKNIMGSWIPVIAAVGAALVAVGLLSPWTALAVGAVYVISHWEKVKGWFEDFWARLKAGFNIVWDALKVDAYKAALAMIEPFSHLPAFLGGWARDAKKRLEAGLSGIQSDMGKNIDTITASWGDAGKSAGASWASGFINSVDAQRQAIADSTTRGTGVTYGPGGSPMSAIPGRVTSTPSNPQGIAQGALTPSGIHSLLVQAGATKAQANFLTAISGREDASGNPGALNDSLKTHDYSVGLFQINFRDMQNRWMRGGKQAAAKLAVNPLAQAQYALSLLHSQGPSAWSTNTPAIQALLGGGGGGGMLPPTNTGGTTKKAPAYKIPDALEAGIRKAQQSFADDVTKQHLGTLDDLYKREEALLKAHGQDAKAQSVANEITKADQTFQKKLTALHLAVAKSVIAKIETESTGPAQALKLAQAAGQSATVILDDENNLQAAYTTEAAQLKAKMAASSGKAKAAYHAALTKVQAAVASTQDSIVSTLQGLAQTAQQKLSSMLGTVESAADAQLGSRYYQGGQTPSEALLASMQAQDTASSLNDALTTAQQQYDLDKQTVGVTQAQLDADQKAIVQAQRAIDENNLSLKATAERAQADADFAKAEFNLNTGIEALAANVGDGSKVQEQLNALLDQFGIKITGLVDPGGNGVFDQLQGAIGATIAAFGALNAKLGATPAPSLAPNAAYGLLNPGTTTPAVAKTYSVNIANVNATDASEIPRVIRNMELLAA